VTWEEGTWAAWLYDLLQPQAAQGCCHLLSTFPSSLNGSGPGDIVWAGVIILDQKLILAAVNV
jgi:hypothetical protein